MDTRVDFQRLLEDMDKILTRRREELAELDERLNESRRELSEKEAKELASQEATSESLIRQQNVDQLLGEQRALYERQLAQLNDELAELEISNGDLSKQNEAYQMECESLRATNERLAKGTLVLRDNLKQLQEANEQLRACLDQTELESGKHKGALEMMCQQDQLLMNAFSSRVKSLEGALESKDEEIRKLRADYEFTIQLFGIEINNGDGTGDGTTLGESVDDNADRQLTSTTPPTAPGGLIDSRQKQRLLDFAAAFREKDEQIDLLKSQLLKATRDLESSASLLETLAIKKNRPANQQNSLTTNRTQDPESDTMDQDFVVVSVNEQELTKRCKMLESELEVKDQRLHEVESRNHKFERILPEQIISLIYDLRSSASSSQQTSGSNSQMDSSTINDNSKVSLLVDQLKSILQELNSTRASLDTIEHLKRIIANRDSHIERLVSDLNELDAKLDSIQEKQENLATRDDTCEMSVEQEEEQQTAGATDGRTKEEDIAQPLDNNDNKEEPQIITIDLTGPSQTDDDKSNAQRDQAVCNNPSDGNGTHDSKTTSEAPSELTGKDNQIKPSSPPTRRGLASRKSLMSSSRHLNLSTASRPNESTIKLKRRVRELENENQLLELAMREILMSIRWSDANCRTILIDCPSLERLCQLIEARFISTSENSESDIFQGVLIKSEVDLLRGQNEQLRADLKAQRRDFRDMVENYSDRLATATPSDKSETLVGTPRHQNVPKDVECQTDDLYADKDKLTIVEVTRQDNAQQDGTLNQVNGTKCPGCSRSTKLLTRLHECIARIETRINISEDTYMGRLVALYQLTQQLSEDLASRESIINRLSRKCYTLTQQKLFVQRKVNSLEIRMNAHERSCPLNQHDDHGHGDANASKRNNHQMVLTSMKDSPLGLDRDARYGSDQLPLKDNRMTITLLTMIIDCLKAMLKFKDERLRRLETMIGSRA